MSSNVQGAAQRGTPSDSQEHERAGHTSLYERAFGRGSAEFPADCMSAPLYEHGGGGSMDEQDAEEMLYQRSLVMEHYRKATAQDHACFAYNAQMGGKPFHCGPPEYAMHPQMHQHAIMAHAAASRRSMGDVSDMAHKRGAYGYEMPPYGVMPRRMMFYGDSQGAFHAHQAEMGMYHMAGGVQRRANVPAYPTGMQTPSIDVDACARGRRGMLKGSEMKKELVIFPRRKAGQSKRQADNEAPVKLTPEILESIASIPLVAAAKKLGISKTALKNACRNLGLKRWPFRRRREDARRNALINPVASTPSTLSKTSSKTGSSSDHSGNDKFSPPHATESAAEDDDSDSDNDDDIDKAGARAGGSSSASSARTGLDGGSRSAWQMGAGAWGEKQKSHTLLAEATSLLAAGKGSLSGSIRARDGVHKSQMLGEKGIGMLPGIEMPRMTGSASPSPPIQDRQTLSHTGSQDEDDLFNVGCNHTAAEMWTSSLRVPSPNAAVHTFAGGHSLGPANMTLTDPRHDCHLQVSQDEARGEAAWNMVSYGAAGKAHLTSEPMQNVGGEGFLTLE